MKRGMSQLIVREHLETKWKVPGDFSDSLSFPREGGVPQTQWTPFSLSFLNTDIQIIAIPGSVTTSKAEHNDNSDSDPAASIW